MSKYLVSSKEIYRVGTEKEAEDLIEEAKKDSTFVLKERNVKNKEKMKNGEVEDSWVMVTLIKTFNEEKEPTTIIDVNYNVVDTIIYTPPMKDDSSVKDFLFS